MPPSRPSCSQSPGVPVTPLKGAARPDPAWPKPSCTATGTMERGYGHIGVKGILTPATALHIQRGLGSLSELSPSTSPCSRGHSTQRCSFFFFFGGWGGEGQEAVGRSTAPGCSCKGCLLPQKLVRYQHQPKEVLAPLLQATSASALKHLPWLQRSFPQTLKKSVYPKLLCQPWHLPGHRSPPKLDH